jgi:hypothetical protein
MRFIVVMACATLGLAAGTVGAQTIDRDNGEAGATILQLMPVPRAAGLGGALVAAPGISSVLGNPAAIGGMPRLGLFVANQTLFEDAHVGALAAGYHPSRVAFAVSAAYLSLGSVEEVSCDGCGGRGTPTGQTLSASELAAAASAAFSLTSRIHVGGAVNYHGVTLAGQSSGGVSFSLGAQGRPHRMVAVGVSVLYLGGGMDVGGFVAPLPRTIRLGTEVEPFRSRGGRVHLLLAGEYVSRRGSPSKLGGGIEAGVKGPDFAAVGRVGLVTRADGDFANQPVTFGGGLQWRWITIDYAYQASDVLDGTHRMALTLAR